MTTWCRQLVWLATLLTSGLALAENTKLPSTSRSTIASHYIIADGHRLHYVVKEGQGKTPILFIHGSPGDWHGWQLYLDSPQLADMGNRIAVDRLGFGLSEPTHVMPELRKQAALLAKLLPPHQQTLIVGHSLGSPIAVWLAIDHPDLVCGVVSIAGSLSAKREAARWYNSLANWRIFQPFIPQDMLDSNQEMMLLSQQLQLLTGVLPKLQRPITLIQGQDDGLVDPETVDDMAKLMPPSLVLRIVRVTNQGHFVIWKKPDVVIQAIQAMNCSAH